MPSALMINMLAPGLVIKFRTQGEIKAILKPSGDHFGWQAPSGISVTCFKFVPSIFINQISTAPERVDANAIWDDPPRGVGKGVKVMVGDGEEVGVNVGEGVTVSVGATANCDVGDAVSINMIGATVLVGSCWVGVSVGR